MFPGLSICTKHYLRQCFLIFRKGNSFVKVDKPGTLAQFTVARPTRKQPCFLAMSPKGNGQSREHRFLAMFPEGRQTRKHCFLAMFPEDRQTKNQCFLAMFPEGRQTRKHCFLAMFPEDRQIKKYDSRNGLQWSGDRTLLLLSAYPLSFKRRIINDSGGP